MQHVGSRDSNVQSPALFFAVKSSIIMESYHNVTIYSAGKCTLLLKILKTAFSSQRFAVHREKTNESFFVYTTLNKFEITTILPLSSSSVRII